MVLGVLQIQRINLMLKSPIAEARGIAKHAKKMRWLF